MGALSLRQAFFGILPLSSTPLLGALSLSQPFFGMTHLPVLQCRIKNTGFDAKRSEHSITQLKLWGMTSHITGTPSKKRMPSL
jgi:hypothetical protein